ncbi:hypothetical protein GE09DRAFT_1078366 [Coniochaeta sp. 2T2.1]|nr:hypothetical protein GE09DRAFT_1078366 [Coniochaeta sp. 2T2.1]
MQLLLSEDSSKLILRSHFAGGEGRTDGVRGAEGKSKQCPYRLESPFVSALPRWWRLHLFTLQHCALRSPLPPLQVCTLWLHDTIDRICPLRPNPSLLLTGRLSVSPKQTETHRRAPGNVSQGMSETHPVSRSQQLKRSSSPHSSKSFAGLRLISSSHVIGIKR